MTEDFDVDDLRNAPDGSRIEVPINGESRWNHYFKRDGTWYQHNRFADHDSFVEDDEDYLADFCTEHHFRFNPYINLIEKLEAYSA